MTYEEIKRLVPHFQKWKSDIAFLYGSSYAEKFCTWERFKEHISVLNELQDEQIEVEAFCPESIRSALRERQREIFREEFAK